MKSSTVKVGHFIGGIRVFWMTAAFLAAIFAIAEVAAETAATKEGPDAAFPNQMRAGLILDQAILDPDGNQIGEIADLIIGQRGRVTDVIVAVEGFQKVTVPFDELQFEAQWEYRTVRGRDGQEFQVPWRQYPVITFLGDRKELQARPRYQFDRRYPRGSTTGWGIYSYPKAGPGMKTQ